MICTVTKQKNLSTSLWGGGKTTQMFIFPPDSSYSQRNFQVRISSATVEDDTSIFTALPGYSRILMPLDNSMHLVYKEHGEITLAPFQADEFDGGWQTTSFGKCTDIGIMLAQGWAGKMLAVGKGNYDGVPGFTAIYALSDDLIVLCEKGEQKCLQTLSNGDFLLVESEQNLKLTIDSQIPNAAIFLQVFKV